MTTKTNTFSFGGLELRSLTVEGKPWFVAADACEHLSVPKGSRSMALRRLDRADKGLKIVDTLGGPQKLTVISEPGLYKLIQTSRKPEAREFDRWVRTSVLPAIRQTGGYIQDEEKLTMGDTTSYRARGPRGKLGELECVDAASHFSDNHFGCHQRPA